MKSIKKLIGIFIMTGYMTSAFAQTPEYFTIPENVPKNLPFSEGVKIGDTLYLSGQIGIPPGESELVEGGIAAETRQIFSNMGRVLEHFSMDYKNIVRCQVMLADIAEWPAFNTVYASYFTAPYPARSAFATTGGLAFGARVELECIAKVLPQTNEQCVRAGQICTYGQECCAGLECRGGGSWTPSYCTAP